MHTLCTKYAHGMCSGRLWRFGFVVLVGLVAGLAGRNALVPERDVVMAGFLDSVCLPFVSGDAPQLDGLEPVAGPSGGEFFADPATRALMNITQDVDSASCSISDILDPLSPDMRVRLVNNVDGWGANALPQAPRHDLAAENGWAVFIQYGSRSAPDPGALILQILDYGEAADMPEMKVILIKDTRDA